MAISYPAYQLLFNSVTGSAYELSVFLLLPVLKLVLKNLVAICLADLADLIPENIIFTVHFFNAIYLATSMQSASSTFAVSAIMIIDLLGTGMTLYRIYRSSNRIMKHLQQTIGPSIAKDNLLAAAYSLCHYHDKFTKEERTQVQVRSFFPHQLSTEGHDLLRKLENGTGPTFPSSSNTQSMPTIKNVLPAGSGPLIGSRWSTMIQPVGPTKVTSVQVTRTKRSCNVNAIAIAIAAVPSVQHIASLRKILATLFTLECMILAEYIEFIIPLLYGNYVLMMVHLPSARYHTELTNVTMENVVSTVYMVFLYGLLEVGSFILLVLLLKRGKIIGWTLITLGFRVVHFGVDFTFQFS
ncbi:hypothetical protein C6341_g2431 [Phytophthora cactorum]|uniref:Uncharacterized protein n=1 Tax=Phytophthora cactorum TaxID=29920 RepID=A0A8T1EKJ4_9STRA|nr:hypothetical protein PC117_g2857 [Phytophthora cactorum]KAG3189092.1 hypothetical protein C6341_g2431 [Phytophthora cactorum]